MQLLQHLHFIQKLTILILINNLLMNGNNMSISKLFKVFAICCFYCNIAYTMQEQNSTEVTKTSSDYEVIQTGSDYEVIQVLEFKWNSLPIMFERGPNSYIQGRYINVNNDYNKYICDIWRYRINVYMKIGSKLDYYDEAVTNKFRELSKRIRANNNWDNLNNMVRELFGNNYSVLLLE